MNEFMELAAQTGTVMLSVIGLVLSVHLVVKALEKKQWWKMPFGVVGFWLAVTAFIWVMRQIRAWVGGA